MFLYIASFVGGLIALAIAGPIGLIVFVLGALAFLCFVSYRGALFIRAYCFIGMIGEGVPIPVANTRALALSKLELISLGEEAKLAAAQRLGGSQLKMIALARSMGFTR